MDAPVEIGAFTEEPARAGIDPRNLLIDVEMRDNLAKVTRG